MYIKIRLLIALLLFIAWAATYSKIMSEKTNGAPVAPMVSSWSNATPLTNSWNSNPVAIFEKETKKFHVFGYYPYWSHTAFPASRLPKSHFDWYFHAFAWPDENGKLLIPKGFVYPYLVSSSKEKWKFISLSIWGWQHSDGFKRIAEDPTVRETFVTELTQFVTKNGYNEINIDWEFPNWTEKSAALATMADDIRKRLPYIVLSTSLPIPLAPHEIDIEAIAKAFDYVLVMSYDVETWAQGYAGHNAPLYKNSKMPKDMGIAGMLESEYLSKWVPREKIILWIPLYGRKFPVQDPYAPSALSSPVEYRNLPFGECERLYDNESKAPYLSCQGYYVSYDDEQSISEKIAYAKQEGLWGVFFWALGQDNNLLMEKLGMMD